MEEKKEIKVSLGTTICIIIITILVILLGIVYYIGFVKDKDIDTGAATQQGVSSGKSETDITEDNQDINVEDNQQNVISNNDNQIDGSESDTIQNNQENTNKCYTDGEYYWLMLYKTNLSNVPDLKASPAKEQRTFSLMVNHGYGQQYLYGSYYIENNKITLMIPIDYNYNYVNNTANMMTRGNDVEVKEEGAAYRITLDYTDKVIKYGSYDLIENNQEDINKCYTDGEYYWLMLYNTNLNNVPDLKASPAKEQRTFSLMVNHGYGQQYLYGSYYIENDKIILMVPIQDNYNYVNNTANMMTRGNDVEVKEEGSAYRITLDYTEKVIKYGAYDLNVQSN